MDRVNRSEVPLEKVWRTSCWWRGGGPVVIQRPVPDGPGPGTAAEEIDEYIMRLSDLKDSGAAHPVVQIYSASGPSRIRLRAPAAQDAFGDQPPDQGGNGIKGEVF